MEVLLDQWHDALRVWQPQLVEEAWRGFRDANVDGYWPTPAAILKRLRDLTPPTRETYKSEGPKEFCREGRNVAEEVIYRAAFVANQKRRLGFNSTPEFASDDHPEDGASAP